MVCSYATHNNASVLIFKSLLDNHYQVLSLSTLSGVSVSVHILFTPVLFKFLCFLLFKFFTHYCIFSIDCLSCTNSPDEVFFGIANIKAQIIFIFFSATFHTHQTSASLFHFYIQSVNIALRV